jgi:hypothetical protein
MSDAEHTPIDRPIMLSDLNAMKRVLHNVETVQLAMFEDFKNFRDRIRLATATCIGCAVVSLASAVVTVMARVH